MSSPIREILPKAADDAAIVERWRKLLPTASRDYRFGSHDTLQG